MQTILHRIEIPSVDIAQLHSIFVLVVLAYVEFDSWVVLIGQQNGFLIYPIFK